MKIFSLDTNDRIEVRHSASVKTPRTGRQFATEEHWARMASEFPMSRLVAIWNGLPGAAPVDRFTSRAKAILRIWKGVWELEPESLGEAEQPENGGYRESKKEQMLALLRREEGVSCDRLVVVSGWQKHSVRGFLSGAVRKKMGLKILSSKNEAGRRVYRIEAR